MISAQKVYAMLGNETLWGAAQRVHQILTEAGIPYAICGGVATCLHGYQRNTTDVDIVVAKGYVDTTSESLIVDGIAVRFLLAAERAGKGQAVHIADPADSRFVEQIEGFSVLKLAKLIEMKLASGTGSIRRTHKDFADIVELIVANKLDKSFSRYLHKTVRETFKQLVDAARSE
ncbi:DUF4211 domain-containing protein [Lacunimicrobium album]